MPNHSLPTNYQFAGVRCGVRAGRQRPDLALFVSTVPATAAGAFTQNRVCAAPVQLTRSLLPRNDARGVVVCAGNANACTGERGLRDAQTMIDASAAALSCQPEQMLVCSTGVIGVHLPMENVLSGIESASQQLSDNVSALEEAATSILTTDTRTKIHSRQIEVAGKTVTILGVAKGAAMIGPNMATMLAFVFTDASIEANDLDHLVKQAAAETFNCISVEGHTSTNDTLLLFANGSGPTLSGKDFETYAQTVVEVCSALAQDIARDAEGAEHLIRIDVEGCRTDDDAKRIAKTVAESALVKTAIFGADPNWGRFVSAAGYSGVDFAEKDLSLWLGPYLLYEKGTPQPFEEKAVSAFIRDHREITMHFQLTLGSGRCTFWTCDLTYEYVKLNAEYTT